MPKDIPISNGNLLFNFDSDYRIRDVYFPHVGQENHSKGSPFRFGVWADGSFSWVGPEWEKDLRYRDDSIVTDIHLLNRELGLKLRCADAVDIDKDVHLKKIKVINLKKEERDVRLFFCHDFHLYGNDIGDTAYFDPRTDSVIHYKGYRYFLINCCDADGCGVDDYTCASKEVPEESKVWKDAEDGELGRQPISWGAADSAVGIHIKVDSKGESTVYYWIAAGTNYHKVADLNEYVIKNTPEELIGRTSDFWEAWVRKVPRFFGDLPKPVTDIFNRSLLILKTQIDNRGPIIAANDSDIVRFGKDTYSYMWGRDGAFVSACLSKAGYSHNCEKFFNFCANIISDEGYFYQHYNPDGSLASNWHPWLIDGLEVVPIQEDSTALIIWALWIHFESSNHIEFIRPLYDKLIKKAADFMVSFRDPVTKLPNPSYDLWEERFGVHAFTVASVIAGLRAAENFARVFKDISLADKYYQAAEEIRDGLNKYLFHDGLNRYARTAYRTDEGYELEETIDVSLSGLAILGAVEPDDPRMIETMGQVKSELWLKTPVEGCARYMNDLYQRTEDVPDDIPGNPWFFSTLWLGEYFIDIAKSKEDLQQAVPYLEWCSKNALSSGVLAEQVHPINGSPLSVSPLTWSHSAFVWTVLKYSEKYNQLKDL